MKLKLTYILTLLLLITATATSQTYPVVSTTQIIPPYSVYLSDYASPSSDKLIANLYLQDQNQSGLQVKLKITITGDNGVRLETKPEYMPPPITMYSGSPEQISGIDLQQYLEPVNLNITGLNVALFMQNKKLPEGIYQFTVEAVEYRRNKVVSNPGMAVGWLILNDPPIWNLPQHNSTITATNPQNIFFSWFPMHRGSPNSAFTTEFEFSLYDLIPQTANPDEYVNVGVPIHQSTTMNNNLIYGPAEMPLEPGRKYACRLRAYDTEGRDMFKNNGYSTVLVFTYGQECITPVGINHDGITPHSASVHWTSIPGNTEFEVYYREKSNENLPWYVANTAQTSASITQLKPEHTYQYVIKALCGTLESEPSDIYEFTTIEKTADTLICDGSGDVPEIDGSPPLQELLLGDVINVGGFEGIITQARGSGGVFSGKCIMRLTTYNILLKSHFNDISINQSYQVTAGAVIADRKPVTMINLDEIAEELDSLANIEIDSIIDDPDDYLEDLEIVYDIPPEIITDSIAEDLEEIQDDLEELLGSGDLTEEQQQAIEDLLEQIENLLNNGNQGNDQKSFVMFKAHPEQQYGFDEPDSIISLQQYYQPPNTINGKEQLKRWKSIKANSPDKVYARLDSINAFIKFYNAAGTEITPQNAHVDTLKIINLQGSTAGTTEIIIAKIEENDSTSIEAGMLNVVSYDQIPKTLVIVPVNGNTLPEGMSITQFADSLNKTYGQAIVHWTTEPLHANIDFDYEYADTTAGFDAWPETGVQYSPDMQALINEFQSSGNFNPDKYYVFLVSDPENPVQLGIMPFFQNFAFVFSDKANQAQTFAKTTAHELGHGVFGLEHPFTRHEGIEEFTTENLMTWHSTATYLYKYQWDLIHNPVCWLDGDCGSGEAPVMKDLPDFDEFAEFDIYPSVSGIAGFDCETPKKFLHPSGKILFFTYDIWNNIDKTSFNINENGVLLSFKINNGTEKQHGEYKYANIIKNRTRQLSFSYVCYEYIQDNIQKSLITLNNGESTYVYNNLGEKYRVTFKENENLLPCNAGTFIVTDYENLECKEMSEEDCLNSSYEAIFNIEGTCFISPFNFNLGQTYNNQRNITYLNPANYPITLPDNARINTTAKTGVTAIDTYLKTSGCLRAFTTSDGLTYSGKFQKQGGEWYFSGYRKTGFEEDYFYENTTSYSGQYPIISVEETNPPPANCNSSCFHNYTVSGDMHSTIPEPDNKEGAGNMEYQYNNPTFLTIVNKTYECTDDVLSQIITDNGLPLTWEESEIMSATYDLYGNSGLLIHIFSQTKQDDFYIYKNTDNELNDYYLIWFGNPPGWHDFSGPTWTSLADELRQILSIKSVIIFFAEGGHTVLDVAGMIPIAGEVFDGINALWYFVEGDATNAGLSALSVIPIVGWGGSLTKLITKLDGIKNFGKFVKQGSTIAEVTYDATKVKSVLTRLDNLGISDQAYKRITKDWDETPGLLERMLENPQLADAWKILDDAVPPRTGLRKNIDALEAMANIKTNPSFTKMGLTDEILGNITGAQNLSYHQIINNLDDFGKNIAGKNINLEDFPKVLNDLKKGTGFSDGANWTVKYLSDKADDFTGKTLKFEDVIKEGSGIRRVDIVDKTNPNRLKFFEFKSVSEVPPSHFSAQFMKDLDNADGLDQIKWIFNGSKNPANFNQNMLDAIDDLPLTPQLALKYTGDANIQGLKNLLITEFETIFKLSN